MAVWPVSEGGSYPGEPEPRADDQKEASEPARKSSRSKVVKVDGE